MLAHAKDADMGFVLAAAGTLPDVPEREDGSAGPGYFRTRGSYLAAMHTLVGHGILDIVLTSASNGERLVASGSLDEGITLAIRANDTMDIWLDRGASACSPGSPQRNVRSS